METRKRLLVQIKARQKQGVDELFQDMDAARRLVFDTQVVELENQIECLIAGDVARAETVQILGSVPRIGPVASTMLIAEISGLGQISTEQAAALTGLAPIARDTGHEIAREIAHDSGALRGKRAIGGGRHLLRHVMFQAALVARHHNLVLNPSPIDCALPANHTKSLSQPLHANASQS